MKRLLLMSMGMMLLFASCKKNNANVPSTEQLYAVKFNVGVFNQSIGDFPGKVGSANPGGAKLMAVDGTANTPKLSDYINTLDYFLYNAEGVKIANKTLYADTSKIGFTLPTANLKPGKYTVVFVGSTGKNGTSQLSVYGTTLNDFQILNTLYYETPDVFLQQTQFEVAGTDNNVDISLKRPGGKLKIVIEDSWPSNVDRIGLSINGYTIYYLSGRIYQSDKTDINIYKNYIWTTNMINGSASSVQTFLDCSWENFIFTDTTGVTKLKGVVTAYGKNNDLIVSKDLTDIRVEKNKITTVSGKLFDNIGLSTKSNFSIKIDSDLSGEIKQTF